ncbi:hypothetical protein CN558_23875 [Bacillus wiedmannii]|uniref:Uncharacterized protein n=1 Tax=Bacillus wiedmannii TaxID=1890302 RepID=A0A2A8CBZ0_9BACI|nr:hypothetical protein [Bacillus wiedmannii]PEL82354.1 hypothetical protein CN609_10715 [Bacillus wiedmannii]PEM80989.1 hypothetical protein CN627_29595 [Bacillus wiedmannii]PEO82232.1 hypothetical protein CN558_23875 [Bacillus wiedmannii]PHG63734.1 hypothetical protein COI65_07865 [Bacillus wiedmannii]
MLKDDIILDKLQQFVSGESIQRQSTKSSLADFILSSGETSKAAIWIVSYIESLCPDKHDKGVYTQMNNPELIADLLEVAYESLSRDADLQSYVTQIARLLYIDKKARDTLNTERYVQYRAAVMLDELISLNVSLPPEVVELVLSDYYIPDIPTKEFICSIWRRVAERGINISNHINSLVINVKNHESSALTNNSILALWACIRRGFFDTPISDSNQTYHVWLWHMTTSCVGKLKKTYEEPIRSVAVGCLLETARIYPEVQSLILECMDKWGIAEPKRPRSDFQRDLKELFSRCENHPGINCLPENYVITKRGIMSRTKSNS